MLIGITGLAGSGKSEVFRILEAEFGFTRVKFAGPLKNMLRTMLEGAGFCEDDRERMIEGDLKEVVIPELGVTPRHLMVTLGTEWGRDLVHPEIWTRLWAMEADRHVRVAADDTRFPNEVDLIRARGGQIWRIERPGLVAGTHRSETFVPKADVTIYNTGSLADLRNNVKLALHDATEPARCWCGYPDDGHTAHSG